MSVSGTPISKGLPLVEPMRTVVGNVVVCRLSAVLTVQLLVSRQLIIGADAQHVHEHLGHCKEIRKAYFIFLTSHVTSSLHVCACVQRVCLGKSCGAS